MLQIDEKISWGLGFSTFLLVRFLNGVLFSVGTVALTFVIVYCLWAIIAPFFSGKTISPGGGLDFRVGEHDIYRWSYFLGSLYIYFLCLSK